MRVIFLCAHTLLKLTYFKSLSGKSDKIQSFSYSLKILSLNFLVIYICFYEPKTVILAI